MKLLGILLLTTLSLQAFSSENNVYDFSWLDPDKKVYVLQNRKFRKSGKFYLGTTFGRSVSGAFIDSMEANVYTGYFFKEDWGIELSYTKSSSSTNSTHDAVNLAGAVAFYRALDTVTTAHLVWSPFYSKINTFNKIFYYDWLFGLGFSSYTSMDNRNEFGVTNKSELTKDSGIGVSWFTGMRFFINENWSSRVDFTGMHTNADRALGVDDLEKSMFHYYHFRLGINYTF